MIKIFQSVSATYRDRGFLPLVSAMGYATLAIIWQHILKKRFLKKRIHNYKMLLDLCDKGLSRSLLLFGTREIDHKILLEKIVSPEMNIFDVGANIGYYPLMELNLLNPKGKLVAIEPFPQNVELLKQNLFLNGYSKKVPIITGAISDSLSKKLFHISSHSNLGTFHPQGSGSEFITGNTIEVNTYSIPEIARTHGQPDLIRMDVEGHEVEVINGMLDAICAGIMRPKIIFETHLTRYSKEHENWPDLQTRSHLNFMPGWCAGAPGIGLSRIDPLKHFPEDSDLGEDLNRAIAAVENHTQYSTDHICCGRAGQISFLYEAGRIDQARTLAQGQLERMQTKVAEGDLNGCSNKPSQGYARERDPAGPSGHHHTSPVVESAVVHVLGTRHYESHE